MNKEYFNGVGRRKNSTARVYLSDGKGKFSINNVSDDINTYLKRESLVIHAVKPLEVLNLKDKYDIIFYTSPKDVKLIDDGERSVDRGFRNQIINIFNIYFERGDIPRKHIVT